MKILRTKNEMKTEILKFRSRHPKGTIGFVPTMGYLHEGHVSLIRAARKETDLVVVSLFVNPTQFGPSEDFKSYPRDENRDAELCKRENANILFIPLISDMYSKDHLTFVQVKKITHQLCGKYRTKHFEGVSTIVLKLFNLIDPDISYFGQKDGQQCLVIQKMVQDLNVRTSIKIMPTVREPDGLAMSSRNVYLDPESRKKASLIYKSLQRAKQKYISGTRQVKIIIDDARQMLDADPDFKVQYFECRSLDSLKRMNRIDRPCILATAVFLGGVRLIDNIILTPETVEKS